MTLTALLKPVLLSINFLPRSLSIFLPGSLQPAPVGGRPTGSSGIQTRAHSLVIVIPRVSDSEQGGVAHLHIATEPFNCLAFGHHRGYRMYRVQSGGSHSAR